MWCWWWLFGQQLLRLRLKCYIRWQWRLLLVIVISMGDHGSIVRGQHVHIVKVFGLQGQTIIVIFSIQTSLSIENDGLRRTIGKQRSTHVHMNANNNKKTSIKHFLRWTLFLIIWNWMWCHVIIVSIVQWMKQKISTPFCWCRCGRIADRDKREDSVRCFVLCCWHRALFIYVKNDVCCIDDAWLCCWMMDVGGGVEGMVYLEWGMSMMIVRICEYIMQPWQRCSRV